MSVQRIRDLQRQLQYNDALLDRVAATFEAGRARFLIGYQARLILLHRSLVLRLRLRCVLPPALTASRDCTRRRPRTGITHHSSDDRTSRCPSCARARRGAGRGGSWLRSGRLLRRVGRIILALLYGPGMTLAFVLLLLSRRLAFGRIDVLLRPRARRKKRRGDQRQRPLCTFGESHCHLLFRCSYPRFLARRDRGYFFAAAVTSMATASVYVAST